MNKNKETAVKMSHITKTFGTVVANNDVSLDVYYGEILSLLGENGSGKTTLMNMLAGIYYPDSGSIDVDGKRVVISSPKDAFNLGIGMVHQHFKLVDVLSAAENIVLGLPGSVQVNRKKLSKNIKEIADQYGFDIDPDKKVYNMSVSEKQTVEIVKALYRGANILILDEPTAVLTPQEAERLFVVLRNMRADGKAIIIITHKLDEVLGVSDRVAILRKGTCVDVLQTKDADVDSLVEGMVGHATSLEIERKEPQNPQNRLQIKELFCADPEGLTGLQDVSFTLRSGEILGVAGITGSGQKALCEAITGLYPVDEGSILYIEEGESKEIVGLTPTEIRTLGIHTAFVPEDRLGMGLVDGMDMVDNMMLKSYDSTPGLFVSRKEPKKLAEKLIKQLDIDTPGTSTAVRKLSGGNVQKVLLGREIASDPSVLVVAYPARGLDINSSYTVYRLLNEQKSQGVAILLLGEDLDVLLELCDRILVLCDGAVSGIVDARTTTKNEIGLLMTQRPAHPQKQKEAAQHEDN